MEKTYRFFVTSSGFTRNSANEINSGYVNLQGYHGAHGSASAISLKLAKLPDMEPNEEYEVTFKKVEPPLPESKPCKFCGLPAIVQYFDGHYTLSCGSNKFHTIATDRFDSRLYAINQWNQINA